MNPVVYLQLHMAETSVISCYCQRSARIVNGVLSAAVKVCAVTQTATAVYAQHRRYTGNWVIYA